MSADYQFGKIKYLNKIKISVCSPKDETLALTKNRFHHFFKLAKSSDNWLYKLGQVAKLCQFGVSRSSVGESFPLFNISYHLTVVIIKQLHLNHFYFKRFFDRCSWKKKRRICFLLLCSEPTRIVLA